jgi:hypothetical protein
MFVFMAAALALAMVGVGWAREPSNQLAVAHLQAANLMWVDTGVDVQPDMAYPVEATGTIFTVPPAFSPPSSSPGQGRAGQNGPAGQIYTCYDARCPMYGVGWGAIVGKIGTSGTPFYVGAGPGFSVPGVSAVGGRLYLAINDCCYDASDGPIHNVKSGSFTVSVLSPVPIAWSGVVPNYGP